MNNLFIKKKEKKKTFLGWLASPLQKDMRGALSKLETRGQPWAKISESEVILSLNYLNVLKHNCYILKKVDSSIALIDLPDFLYTTYF